ncbi:MAG: YciI family protein [Bacillota bacterium]
MRFMMIVKATKDSEAGVMPSQEMIDKMMAYNEALVKAGVLLAGEGLHPSSNAIRISYPIPGGKPVVTDGPFPETKELIAGFWLIQVKSREEAIEWALRAPDPHGGGEGQIELRQVFDDAEINQDPESLARETELRRQLEQQQKS